MSTAPMIRNIQQSVQYRSLTKQATDIVVYVDGQNILVNPYLGTTGVPVPINDYVSAFQANYGVDAMIPTAGLTLSVPTQDKHLFRAPGGNNLLKTMSQVRAYMKGSVFSSRGNTVYRQIFSGFITSINYSDSGKFLSIGLSLAGSLGLLERMQIDLSPQTMSSSPMEVTPFSSNQWNLNPYQQIAWIFLYGSMIDGFETYSIEQMKMNAQNPYYEAVESNYVAKWQALLFDLARDVHIFGCPDVDNVIQQISAHVKPSDATGTPYSKDVMAVARDTVGRISESDDQTQNADFYSAIRNYMPDMSIGNIQLLNGRYMSRLERLRQIVSLIGFEAYQDLDGSIVIKPPLYNLDVTNVGDVPSGQSTSSTLDPYSYFNPFIISPEEIFPGEAETEDEGAVRVTRMTVQSGLNPGYQIHGTESILAVSEEVDIPKLAQFGLRAEPPHRADWFRDGDVKGAYAWACAEMARANRSFRVYTVTIAARPELKIGFPVFFPHKGIYGYIQSISLNYTQGGDAASMTIVCDSLRRRPMFPTEQTVTQADGTKANAVILTSQKNLILRLSQPGTSPPKTQSPVDLSGRIASLPTPSQIVRDQEIQMLNYRKNKIGNNYGTESDMTDLCWRIQPDSEHKFDSDYRATDAQYLEDLRSTRPYTDGSGYELIGPFPWGRWRTLRDAIYDFTIADALGTTGNTLNPAITPGSTETTIDGVSAYLFTGDVATTSSDGTAEQIVDDMKTQQATVANNKIIELTYSSPEMPSSLAGIQSLTPSEGATNDFLDAYASNQALEDARTATFLDGSPVPSDSVLSILSSITPETFTGQANPTGASDLYTTTPESFT